MTATYNATDNTLKERPWKPEPRELDYYSTSVYTDEPTFDDEGLAKALAEYRAHLATLRTIPCSPECRGVFENGKTYEEGKDYEVREESATLIINGEARTVGFPSLVAFPLPVKSDDITDRTFSFDETLGLLIDFGNMVLRNKSEKWDMSNDAAEWLSEELKTNKPK